MKADDRGVLFLNRYPVKGTPEHQVPCELVGGDLLQVCGTLHFFPHSYKHMGDSLSIQHNEIKREKTNMGI